MGNLRHHRLGLGRALRFVSALAAFVAVWLAWSPARAAAPVCDPRGAITFAPPPQIQDLEQSLDAVDPCDGRAEDARDARHVTRGHGATFDLSSSQESATATAFTFPGVAALARVPAPEPTLARPLRGVRSGVDRPPRG